MHWEQIFASGAIVLTWAISVFIPRWNGKNNLGAQNAITKKSKWMQGEARAFARRFILYTALPVAVLPLLWSTRYASLYVTGYVMIGFLATRFFSRKLSKQWELWQQLGYDGPPALEVQQEKLEQTNTLTQ